MVSLFDYFKTQFNSLEDAKKWYIKWKYDWDQDIPERPDDSGDNCYSLRSMAGHISLFLEGKSEKDWPGSYMFTKYGSDLYFA